MLEYFAPAGVAGEQTRAVQHGLAAVFKHLAELGTRPLVNSLRAGAAQEVVEAKQ